MKIIKLNTGNQEEVINETLAVLKESGLVIFPSDTVYGLLADSTNAKAINKLLSFKERPAGKAISVFVTKNLILNNYIIVNQNAKNIIKNLLPGPFTLICKSKHETDPRLEAENGTLGIRIPKFEPILNLVEKFGKPITATSANLSGEPPCYSIPKLIHSISERKMGLIDLVVDYGRLPYHKPSTVVDTTSGELKTLRLGDLFLENTTTLLSKSEEETREFGRFLAAKFIKKTFSKPVLFLLQGDLGTGKTILAKGVGKALNIKEEIISPTYTISYEYNFDFPLNGNTGLSKFDVKSSHSNNKQEYQSKHILVHYDLYRIEDQKDFKELNFIENLVCGNVYIVEWPERLSPRLITALKNSAEIIYVSLKHCGNKPFENTKDLVSPSGQNDTREITWTKE